jgi:hypothetical protein
VEFVEIEGFLLTKNRLEKAEACLWNESPYLAPGLGVTKLINVGNMIWVTLCCAI